MQKITRIVMGVLGLLLAAWLVWAFLPASFEVDVAEVARGPLAVSVVEDGVVRSRDRYVVSAPIAANLQRIALRVGDRVSAGQLLVRLEPLPFSAVEREEHVARLAVARARAAETEQELARLRAAREQAAREEARAAELTAGGFVSAQKHEQAKLDLARALREEKAGAFRQQAAQADMHFSEIALRLGEDRGRVLDLVSPVQGAVTEVLERSERVVAPGAPLLVVSDTARLEVAVAVLSSDAVQIRAGMPLFVDNWGGPKSIQLRVREIEPSAFTKISALGVEEQRVNVIAELASGGPLAEGYRVEGRIVLAQKADALKVPASAVFRLGEGWAVFRREGNRARRVAVGVGLRNATEVEISSGLAAGDSVILNPPAALADGSRIEARTRGPHAGSK